MVLDFIYFYRIGSQPTVYEIMSRTCLQNITCGGHIHVKSSNHITLNVSQTLGLKANCFDTMTTFITLHNFLVGALWDQISHEQDSLLNLKFLIYGEHSGCVPCFFREVPINNKKLLIVTFSHGEDSIAPAKLKIYLYSLIDKMYTFNYPNQVSGSQVRNSCIIWP